MLLNAHEQLVNVGQVNALSQHLLHFLLGCKILGRCRTKKQVRREEGHAK